MFITFARECTSHGLWAIDRLPGNSCLVPISRGVTQVVTSPNGLRVYRARGIQLLAAVIRNDRENGTAIGKMALNECSPLHSR